MAINRNFLKSPSGIIMGLAVLSAIITFATLEGQPPEYGLTQKVSDQVQAYFTWKHTSHGLFHEFVTATSATITSILFAVKAFDLHKNCFQGTEYRQLQLVNAITWAVLLTASSATLAGATGSTIPGVWIASVVFGFLTAGLMTAHSVLLYRDIHLPQPAPELT